MAIKLWDYYGMQQYYMLSKLIIMLFPERYYISSGCKCRMYSKSEAVKLRNFIGFELVVNKIMIYEGILIKVEEKSKLS